MATFFGLLRAIRTHFVMDRKARAFVIKQSFPIGQQACNWDADSSRGSTVHLSRERTALRDLEPNLS